MSLEQKSTNLPPIAPTRLPYHPALKERYNIDQGQWRVLVDAIFPSAQTIEAVVMAISYCQNRKLDPFKRQVHIVPIWSSEKRCYIETVWPSISELRTTAFRTGSYAGSDPTDWGPDIAETFGTGDQRCEVTYPEWAAVTIYRLVAGQRCAFPGPRCYWKETFSKAKAGAPNPMWTKRPRGQIEKCAMAAALRNAFPEEIGGDLTNDEAETIQDYHAHIAVPHDAPAPRLSKVEMMAATLAHEPMAETVAEEPETFDAPEDDSAQIEPQVPTAELVDAIYAADSVKTLVSLLDGYDRQYGDALPQEVVQAGKQQCEALALLTASRGKRLQSLGAWVLKTKRLDQDAKDRVLAACEAEKNP